MRTATLSFRRPVRLLALGAAFATTVAVAAPAHAVTSAYSDDADDDVVVDGGVMSRDAYAAADIDFVEAENVQGSVLRLRYNTDDASPGTAATVDYDASILVKQRKPRDKPRPRAFTVVVSVVTDDPLEPLTLTSNRTGSVEPVSCPEAVSRTDGGFDLFIDVPLSCLGGKPESGTISWLVTAVDSSSGARGRDGAKTTAVSLRRGRL